MIDVMDRPRPTGRTAADIAATLGIVATAVVSTGLGRATRLYVAA